MSAARAVPRLSLTRFSANPSTCEHSTPSVLRHLHHEQFNICLGAFLSIPAARRHASTASRSFSQLRQPRLLRTLASLNTALPPFINDVTQHHRRPSSSSSSSSSTRWKTRQSGDYHAQKAKLAGLKSRAAYKLLEIDTRHRIFRAGDTVVDLGFAPGSWSQVAASRTKPGGRVVGIDVLPAQPPKGVSTLQGDFLSKEIREEVVKFVREPMLGRARSRGSGLAEGGEGVGVEELEEEGRGVLGRERRLSSVPDADGDAVAPPSLDNADDVEVGNVEASDGANGDGAAEQASKARSSKKDAAIALQREADLADGRVVNVVLSDMSEPWPQADASTWLRSVSNPYRRMMNTSGMAFRDHAGSMDLCFAALMFCNDTLVTGGHFLCKFYDGNEAHAFEMRLKKLFEKVHRIKPDASRKESKEAYFIGLRRRAGVERDDVLGGYG